MKESIDKILTRTDPIGVEFRDVILPRKEGETLGMHMERIMKAIRIEIIADRKKILEKISQSDIIVVNHPTSLDIVILGALFGDIPYAVVTQRKRAIALKKLFGDITIYPVPVGHNQFKEFMASVENCIAEGRKLVLFPSGGSEIKGEGDSWFPLYNGILESEILAGKIILPLRIDTVVAGHVQQLVGDKENGREVFPELHYTIPAEKIGIPIISGDMFEAQKQSEQHYKEAFHS